MTSLDLHVCQWSWWLGRVTEGGRVVRGSSKAAVGRAASVAIAAAASSSCLP